MHQIGRESTSDIVDAAGAGSTVIHEVGSDEEPEEIGNGALDPVDEQEAAEPGDDNLQPHGLKWTPAPGGVTSESPDVSRARQKLNPSIVWGDEGLAGNARAPEDYFMHLYPDGHVPEMLAATNANLDEHGGERHLTEQEFFQLLGLLLLASMFPAFTMDMLFRSAFGALGTYAFLKIPDLSEYMSYDRFKKLMRHIDFALQPAPDEQRGVFWKVQPLIDAFNSNRAETFHAGWKLVADESMSAWRGHDQRHGLTGCPHVTKIIRKPKGVGMEIKNLCDVASGVMLVLEIVGPKEEMNDRKYTEALGSGTALLLRLSQRFAGSGRLVVADSAFASVKAAVELKKTHGLDFIGLVKTASRKFPKKYFEELELDERGDHAVLTATERDVELMAVTWNEGKTNKKNKKITKKNIIATCGTTLPGAPHKKRRWCVHANGSLSKHTVDVKRPRVTAECFNGAQMIDVHNHGRQGSLALESRRTQRWDWRFFQTFLGILTVDAFSAFKHFRKDKRSINHTEFLLAIIAYLLDNKIGVLDTSPVLRPRGSSAPASPGEVVAGVHDFKLLKEASYYIDTKHPVLSCRQCKRKCCYFCATCTKDDTKPRCIVALCGGGAGRNCFLQHQLATKSP
eukprot:INCI14073.1.p1 GENE.INCI14073.1~~INCI14073.1.p1  ORF type:complete len:625 (+),score=97.77 INCI14073.1:326-2200(+)